MKNRLTIGVYPFGFAAGPDGIASGRPDDLGRIRTALERLAPPHATVLARSYVIWVGPEATATVLAQISALVETGLTWDLVLAYRNRTSDIESWCEFVAEVVRRYGTALAAVQITGEPNLIGIPDAGDGTFPRVIEALVRGVAVAAETKRTVSATAAIGFAVVPEQSPLDGRFWPALAAIAGPEFAANVDYAGLDMYPDVFGGRIELKDLDRAVDAMLGTFRDIALPLVGIGRTTPIRVCETGWPTGEGRSEEQQAEVLDRVLRRVHGRRHDLNITHWELFALRDADSTRTDPFHLFGIMRDDYAPKPAFDRLRRTIAELWDDAEK